MCLKSSPSRGGQGVGSLAKPEKVELLLLSVVMSLVLNLEDTLWFKVIFDFLGQAPNLINHNHNNYDRETFVGH